MKNRKKVYSTAEGLLYSASRSFGNASLAMFANMLWQFLLQLLKVSGVTAMLLGAVGYVLLLYSAIVAYNAFECEIQADAIAHEKTDRALPVLKKAVMACIIVRVVLTIVAAAVSILLSSAKGTIGYRGIDALINVFGNIFTTVNLLGVFSYKLFIKEGFDKKIRIYACISMAAVIAHFLLAELRYFLIIFGSAAYILSYAALISSVISYFALFLLFEARKAHYKPQEPTVQ